MVTFFCIYIYCKRKKNLILHFNCQLIKNNQMDRTSMLILYIFYFSIIFTTKSVIRCEMLNSIKPVILIPGVESSRLEIKLIQRIPFTNEILPCKSNSNWFIIWLDINSFIPVECWINNMKLLYNSSSRTTENIPGVFIKPSQFGNTSGVETLSKVPLVSDHIYMKPLIDRFIKSNYYIRGNNIRAAPYDFRKAPNEQIKWFQLFKKLIEDTYTLNNNEKIVLISHSLGGMFTYIFLMKQTTDWKNKFIHNFILVSTPLGGSLMALKTLATGSNVNLIPFKQDEIRSLEASFPIVPFLLPSPLAWSSNEPLVLINNSSIAITTSNYNDLFNLLNLPDVSEMYHDVKDLMGNLDHPGVNVTCIYSLGKETVSNLVYSDINMFPLKPNIIYGPGDGTVNEKSLKLCLKWSQVNEYTFKNYVFDSLGHSDLIKSDQFIEQIFHLVTHG